MKIGFLINPIAGIGGPLGWKGSDNIEKAWKVIHEGYKQPVWDIAKRALNSLSKFSTLEVYFASKYPSFPDYNVVYQFSKTSNASDTYNAVKQLIKESIDLLIFVGGDGTAVDVSKFARNTPIIGIPAGVKIFSPCFLHTPEDIQELIENWNGSTKRVDLFDLDEKKYSQGKIVSKLVGAVFIPLSDRIQNNKTTYATDEDEETYRLIADRIVDEELLEEKIILIGPGSTMKGICTQLNINKSLLGVDVVINGELIRTDCTNQEIKSYAIDEIWLTPIGNQGHILGRGNKQLDPEILSHIKRKNLRLFATPSKMRNTPYLYVDTGNVELDLIFKGYYHVITGYYEEVLRKCK